MPAPYIENFFELSLSGKFQIQNLTPAFGFGAFGEVVFYRTYSRIKHDWRNPEIKDDGVQESWADVVIRVTNGTFSIRKDHSIKHGLAWSDEEMQPVALRFAMSMFNMEWLPPGRGLFSMGTRLIILKGSAPLFNCSAVTTKDMVGACNWIADMLMCGVGVGFDTEWDGNVQVPDFDRHYTHVISDDREGWANSISTLLAAYIPDSKGEIGPFPIFDYSKIRPKGTPIKTFGGVASGHEPLKLLHNRIEEYMQKYLDTIKRVQKEVAHDPSAVTENEPFEERMKTETFNRVRTCVDIINAIACCVVSAGVRRSSLIALGDADDEVFCRLKDYNLHPERMQIGGQSNNSLVLKTNADFEEAIPKIAKQIKQNGEPGFFNLLNVQKYGRHGKEMADSATLVNPCGEIPLESFELCNLAEVFPTRCRIRGEFSETKFKEALTFATFYCSTVTLLPTHRPETNRVISRNRRIGVSLSGLADFYDEIGTSRLNAYLDAGYRLVRKVNRELAEQAGIPASIRVTTVKPSGSISQLAGVSSGMHFPSYKKCIRRIRITTGTKICDFLISQGVPHEPDVTNPGYTTVFDFPIDMGSARRESEVNMWEQAAFQMALQRWWADNAVSCTIKFEPETEVAELERLIAMYAPYVKGMSLLPHWREEAMKVTATFEIPAVNLGSSYREILKICEKKIVGCSIPESNGTSYTITLEFDPSITQAELELTIIACREVKGVTAKINSMPKTPYPQMPYEHISDEKYNELVDLIGTIDWKKFGGSDGEMPKYCTNESCDL